MSDEPRSERFRVRAGAPLRKETLIRPEPALGLVAMNGPGDPEPSLVITDGVVSELDGKPRAQFDTLDRFIAAHGIDLDVAPEAMALADSALARLLVDVDVPRSELVRLARGLTPAKLARVVGLLDPVEMMFALKRLRARRAPANQAHVTNLKENPALLAADAAEAALRGFAECETTVGVSRYAPLNAMALLVGSQTGRSGVMTQCAVEERLNLRLAIQGLVSYAETLSVYGTDKAFDDGDDTPWSKAFLASAYASRGVKVRFTSGTGSEALMGHSEGCSMLALEARCLSLVRACGSQGVQNGAISCVALTLSLPGGTRAILAENLIAAWLDLEVASGNDAIASHSPTRRTAKLMGQFLPGTDFVTSGYSVMPRHDNTFGGGNYDADDLDEWMTLQRDWQVDAGIEPALGGGRAGRARARRAGDPGRLRRARLPRRDRRGGARRDGRPLEPRPARPRPRRGRPGRRPRAGRAHHRRRGRPGAGSPRLHGGRRARRRHAAPARLGRLPADLGRDRRRRPACTRRSTTRTTTAAPARATCSRASAGRCSRRCRTRSTRRPSGSSTWPTGRSCCAASGRRSAGRRPTRWSSRSGPAFGDTLRETIGGIPHEEVLRQICAGIEEEGVRYRVIRIARTSDVAFIAHDGAQLAGSGIAIGLQSKGTAVIHRADLQPLDNLELFGMAPLLRPESYRQIGRNAARYANGGRASPVPLVLDNFARAKLIVRTTLLHRRETEAIEAGAGATDVTLQ